VSASWCAFRRGGGEWEQRSFIGSGRISGRPMTMIASRTSGLGGQAASFSLALALIIAAPFSAIMIVGALVFVELTAGIAEASMIRSASRPWTWSWSSTTDMA
jgi:hypothetical protein